MKNEKLFNTYCTLHSAEIRLSIAMRRVQRVQEWIDDKNKFNYLNDLNEFEVINEIHKAIIRTLDANSALNQALSQVIHSMEEQ